MSKISKVSKTWDFTINNYSSDDEELLKVWTSEVSRMVVSREVSKTGTPHLQGRVTFKRAYRGTGLKKLHDDAHWEPTECQQDSLYCMKKESDVFINVDNRQQGRRTDLEDVAEMIKNGSSVSEVAKAYPGQYIKYYRGIQELHKIFVTDVHKARHDLASCCERLGVAPLMWHGGVTEVIVGPPGCGKTQYALAHFENPLFVRHKQNLGNFVPGVHDGIVFDDMSFKHWPEDAQKHVTDWDEPSDIEIKYSVARIPCNTRKVMTCNEICVNLDNLAIRRRVHVTEVGEGNTRLPPTLERQNGFSENFGF